MDLPRERAGSAARGARERRGRAGQGPHRRTRAATLTLEACAPATDATLSSSVRRAAARRHRGRLRLDGGLAELPHRARAHPLPHRLLPRRGRAAPGATAADVASLALPRATPARRARRRDAHCRRAAVPRASPRSTRSSSSTVTIEPDRTLLAVARRRARLAPRGARAYRDTRTRKGDESMNESRSSLAREVAAEFLGTFVLIAFGAAWWRRWC